MKMKIIIPIRVCRLRETGRMSKSVYVRVVHDLKLLRYVLRCEIERQLKFPAGMDKVYCYCYILWRKNEAKLRTSFLGVPFNVQTFFCIVFQYKHSLRHSIRIIVQELCESRGGRPGLSVLRSLLVSVGVKL